MPIISAPPGRLSTTICCFNCWASSAATSLATVSEALPGACGTISLIGRTGYSAAGTSICANSALALMARILFSARSCIRLRARQLDDARVFLDFPRNERSEVRRRTADRLGALVAHEGFRLRMLERFHDFTVNAVNDGGRCTCRREQREPVVDIEARIRRIERRH